VEALVLMTLLSRILLIGSKMMWSTLARCTGLAVKPTCINRAAVAGLRRHLKPRAVHIVTSTARQCIAFRSWGVNVQCHTQVSLCQ